MGADDFYLDIECLTEFVGQLDELADTTGTLAQKLYAVTADTGRSDSDEMGRLAPADAAGLLDGLRVGLADDGLRVAACIANSTESDAASAAWILKS